MALVARCGARALRRFAACPPKREVQARALHHVAFGPTVAPAAAAHAGGGAGTAGRPPAAAWQQARAFSGSVVTQVVKDFGAESITEGTLVEFRKKAGDTVTKGEILASIETDKVTVEVNADESGVVKDVLVKPDDNVVVGQALCKIEVGGVAAGAAAPSPSAPAAAAPAAAATPGRIVEQSIKDFGAESITEGTLMEWRKKVGEAVAQGEILAVIETDKVSIELKAEESGVIKEILAKPDETVEVGRVLVKIEAGAAPAAGASEPAAAPAADAPAPAAADMEGLTGIRAGFAKAAAARAGGAPGPPPPGKAAPAAAPGAQKAAAAIPPATAVGEGRTERRVPMTLVRRHIIERLKDAQNAMALLTTFQEVDLTASLELRDRYKDLFQKTHGAPLGLLSLFVKASACGLLDIPGVNGYIDDGSNEIVYRPYCDISVPIPSPRGPVSCALRNAESMTVRDIERSIAGLSAKARKDELSVDDMSGSTFGIVDNGAVGGMLSTSFINPPASAVLGTNAVQKRVAIVGGKPVVRPMMFLALTYDHRLVDGREAVTFLASVRDKLEDPSRLLLDI